MQPQVPCHVPTTPWLEVPAELMKLSWSPAPADPAPAGGCEAPGPNAFRHSRISRRRQGESRPGSRPIQVDLAKAAQALRGTKVTGRIALQRSSRPTPRNTALNTMAGTTVAARAWHSLGRGAVER